MKLKTFIILLVITFIIPVIIFNIRYKDEKKLEKYYSYDIKVKESQDDIKIVHKLNEDMDLNINFKNNKNYVSSFNMIVFINNEQVNFKYNDEDFRSLSFNTDKEEFNFNITLPKKYLILETNKVTVTFLKQEKNNKYNDTSTKTYLVYTESDIVNNFNYEEKSVKSNIQKLDCDFMGMILNDDIAYISDYGGENYNNKIFESQIRNGQLDLAVRVPKLIKDKMYLIYFTLGDKQIEIEKGKKYIMLTPKETGAYFINVDLKNIDLEKNDYLYCHLVDNFKDENNYKNNIISNKIYIYK